MPTLDWVRRMVKKKIDRINSSKLNQQISNSSKKSGARTKSQEDAESSNNRRTARFSNRNRDQSNSEDMISIHDMPIYEEKFDPFRKTGTPFGSLKKEVQHRYAQYLSDITDGLNLSCLMAFVFIFTLCFAPALCFGGILGMQLFIYTFWFKSK